MSFGGKPVDGQNEFQKKFVSEDELDDKRKKRQEEWEKVRKPEDPKEAPEEVYDNRSLYERLEEQKQKKEEEYQEQFALKNQVKGLGEDEVEFLDFVSKRQDELDKERRKEDNDVLKEYRDTVAAEKIEAGSSIKTESKPTRAGSQGKRSQQALLMGAVKRKSQATESEVEEKKIKSSDSPDEGSQKKENGIAKVIGVLPGLGAYDVSSDDLSDSESTSDDDEGLRLMGSPKKIVIVHHQ